MNNIKDILSYLKFPTYMFLGFYLTLLFMNISTNIDKDELKTIKRCLNNLNCGESQISIEGPKKLIEDTTSIIVKPYNFVKDIYK